jgi:hypothetical protein
MFLIYNGTNSTVLTRGQYYWATITEKLNDDGERRLRVDIGDYWFQEYADYAHFKSEWNSYQYGKSTGLN